MVLDATSLRQYMTLTGITEIVDGQFTNAISDATAINASVTSDETALKFYSAYLLSKSLDWKTLKKSGDAEFFEQKPETYLDLFNLRMDAIAQQASEDGSGGMGIVVRSDPKDTDTTLI